jgi:hypothetical protein
MVRSFALVAAFALTFAGACSVPGEAPAPTDRTDAGSRDAAIPDAGINDASFPDAGTPDAGPPDLVITVDLGREAFPPLFPKLGFNGNWNTIDTADARAAEAADQLGMSFAAGLVETGEANLEMGSNATMASPPFVRDAQGSVAVRIDPNLRLLRKDVRDRGLVNFLQWAGTPRPASGFAVDPALTASPNGNHYPLPVLADTPALADAFAKLSLATETDDGTPTIWALWQEPDHTIGANLTRQRSLERFVPFFARTAAGLVAGNRDAMIAGVQQNASAGISRGGATDGADYQTWVDVLTEYERVSRNEVPLDVVSLQLYKAEAAAQILGNARVAYGGARFSAAPIFVNEWDFDKNAPFDDNYGTAAGLARMLGALGPLLTAPDVDSVLLKRNILSSRPLAFGLVERLAKMPVLRRPVTVAGRDAGNVIALASTDTGRVTVVLSNTSDRARTTDVRLDGDLGWLNRWWLGQEVEVTTFSAPVMTAVFPVATDGTVRSVALPPNTVVVLHRGQGTPSAKLVGARYARSVWSCPRRGGNTEPLGTGHFDPRTSTLIAAAERGGNVGASGVVLRDVLGSNFELSVDTNDTAANLSVRVDFLEGASTTKTIRYAANPAKAAAVWGKVARFRPAGPITDLVLPSGTTTVSLAPAVLAPGTWARADGGARRVQVSVAVESFEEAVHARVAIVGK